MEERAMAHRAGNNEDESRPRLDLNDVLLGQVCYGEPSGDAELYGELCKHLDRIGSSELAAHVGRQVGAMPAQQAEEIARLLLRRLGELVSPAFGGIISLGETAEHAAAQLPVLVGFLHHEDPALLAGMGVREPRVAALLGSRESGGVLGAVAARYAATPSRRSGRQPAGQERWAGSSPQ